MRTSAMSGDKDDNNNNSIMASTTNQYQEKTNEQSFEAAVAALYSSTHQATTKEAIQAAAARRKRTVQDMRTYMKRIGLSSSSSSTTTMLMKNKRLIHITGTKGKGSTAAMCECICREKNGWTTGLFTSPHLIDIRERIRINGKPVSKQIFGQAYWEIRRRLEQQKHSATTEQDDEESLLPILPGYFRMLSLLAMYIFSHYQEPTIDVIILEVGMGGRYDATNVLDTDLFEHGVCGVTLIDYDHVRILGHSLEEIAWEKGGIFQVKKGDNKLESPRPPARSAQQQQQEEGRCENGKQEDPQEENNQNGRAFFALASNTDSVLEVLRSCAAEEGRGGHLVTVGSAKDKSFTNSSTAPPLSTPALALGLHGDHQWDNAALAIALCKHVMSKGENPHDEQTSRITTTTLDKDDHDLYYQALSRVSWPGRCQTIPCNNLCWYLDGAHTVQSVKAGFEWFQRQSVQAESGSHQGRRRRALLFTCSHEREPVQLLQLLLGGHAGRQQDSASGTSSSFGFDLIYFCRSNTERPSSVDKKNARELLQEAGYPVQEGEEIPSCTTRTWQDTLLAVWQYLEQHGQQNGKSNGPPQNTASNLTALEALQRLERMAKNEESSSSSAPAVDRMDVFVTGSLYLAGSVLEALEWKESSQTEGCLRIPPSSSNPTSL